MLLRALLSGGRSNAKSALNFERTCIKWKRVSLLRLIEITVNLIRKIEHVKKEYHHEMPDNLASGCYWPFPPRTRVKMTWRSDCNKKGVSCQANPFLISVVPIILYSCTSYCYRRAVNPDHTASFIAPVRYPCRSIATYTKPASLTSLLTRSRSGPVARANSSGPNSSRATVS